MIGLDTNILLRATLNDDPVQSPKAQQLLKSLTKERMGLINLPVLMEFFWVLRSRYKLPQPRLAGVIRDLMEVECLQLESFAIIGKALAAYEGRAADFADAVIAMRNEELGANTTLTFDADAARAFRSMRLLA